MARGGKRAGAGRKPGAATQRTRAVAERASATGLTPLDVMLDVMRFQHTLARSEMDKGADARPAILADAMTRALNAARDAAPYMHPRLAPVAAQGGETAGDTARKIREAVAAADAVEEAE
ncbi:hypothetical protein GGQ91_003309 [Methylobacterium fujisawaense]|uniref:Terminase small subunit n=1 Tax=Methylobacterium fujisawaense TaxID=107400 RepID=A0ABR6DDA1_9HYPH|nr:hypothetical protein [Methylobacterium fujisawaense]MBA9063908.1 hypothetical protein [Methylobacterium fujisawaense]